MDNLTRLSIEEIKNSEVVHFCSADLLITSIGNKVTIKGVEGNTSITLPIKPYFWIFYFFRLSRRFLRLDKMNVFIGNAKDEIIIFYGGIIYSYSQIEGLQKIDKLGSGRNILHNAAAKTPSNKLIFGEYFGNNKNDTVNIYSLDLESKKLEVAYTFEKNSVRHIHSCYWDEFSKKLWVFTGDFDGECKVLVADERFSKVNILGDGSQKWRAVSAFFKENEVYWLMDSPLETSTLIKYDRRSNKIYSLQEFPSPIYYSLSFVDGGHLIATTHEPGPSVIGNTANIFYSDDLVEWEEIAKFEHDGWSLNYLKYGIIGFSAGPQTKNNFFIFCEALKGMDGKSFNCSLKL